MTNRAFSYQEAAALYIKGMPATQIAEKLGVSWGSIYYALRVLGVKRRPCGNTATFSHAMARRLRARGWTLQRIGERFGVTRERIRQVCLVGDAAATEGAENGR